MKTHKIFAVLTLLVMMSCVLPNTQPMNTQPSQKVQPTSQGKVSEEQRIEKLRERVKNKQAYTGSIQISVNPTLLEKANNSVALHLIDEVDPNFNIQSLPEGKVIFQETFTKDKEPLVISRNFLIPDTSKRYTLHVVKHANNGENGQLNVNINGTNWIKERDFSKKIAEVERRTLLLNANNSLRVHLKGKKGLTATVSVIEGGEVGTILRRRGKLGRPGESQATHLRHNDTNIFNPNDSESLSGLEPYTGAVETPDGSQITAVEINQTETLEFESDTLIFEFQDAQEGLAQIQSL